MAERDWIQQYFQPIARSPQAQGLADDVGLLPPATAGRVITADAMVEGVHFRADDPIGSIARKLVRVNVSDVLASGARPAEAVLVLGWFSARSEGDLGRFAAALGEELDHWGIALVGGDTVTSPAGLFLSLTLTGICGPRGSISRSGAVEGDDVWVTGMIGAAKRGYDALERGDPTDPWVSSYREPVLPDVSVADLLQRHAHAAMDVSDGLLGDARTLAEASSVAVTVDLEAIPFAGGAVSEAEALALATWGDDYQVLFTAPASKAAQIAEEALVSSVKVARIGTIRAGRGIRVEAGGMTVNLPETLGFEHG